MAVRHRIFSTALATSLVVVTVFGCGGEAEQYNCEIQEGDDGAQLHCPDGDTIALDGATDGADGDDGRDGVSCSVDDSPEGAVIVQCDDGTETVIEDGKDGEDGEDGDHCTIDDQEDGGYVLTCDTGLEVEFTDGDDAEDGDDGDDGYGCNVALQSDGYFLSCTDGTELLIADDDGDGACNVDDNDDGTVTVDCGGGPEVTFELVPGDYDLNIFSAEFTVDGNGDAKGRAIVQNRGSDDYVGTLRVDYYFDLDEEPTDSLTQRDSSHWLTDSFDADTTVWTSQTESVSGSGPFEGWVSITDSENHDILELIGPIEYSP